MGRDLERLGKLGAAFLLVCVGCGGSPVGTTGGSDGAVAPYGLTGRVVTLAGEPVANATVELLLATDGSFVTETNSHPDGWFAFLVMDGTYRVAVSAPGFEVTPAAGEEATVAGQDVNLPPFLANPAQ